MRRALTSMVVTCFLLLLGSSQVLAAGTPLKGEIVRAAGPIVRQTGNCACQDNWFTLGLGAGKTTIDVTLRSHSMALVSTYGVRVTVLRGGSAVSFGQAACFASKSNCHNSTRLHFTVHRAGVYYIRVAGPGANEITYALTIHGHLRTIHCAKSCS